MYVTNITYLKKKQKQIKKSIKQNNFEQNSKG